MWAQKAANSVMERFPDGLIDKWTYDYGVILKGFEYVYNQSKDNKYLDYIKKSMDYFVGEDGSIKTYKINEYNIDHVNNGKVLLFLYNETKDEKYKKAATLLREQLKSHPRTAEGAFWHKEIYPYQIWLDGLYMGSPFYAEYVKMFETPDVYDDITKQFILCYNHTKDPETGLLYHAWDETGTMFWCHKNGCSENFWGRSLGWYLMALNDVLDYIPEDHKDRAKLIEILKEVMDAVYKFMDKDAFVWYQVVDKGGQKGNYLEASATSMFVYAMAKGYLKGYLGEEYKERAKKSFDGIITEFVLMTNDGLVNLNKNCAVAGLGGAGKRDGSYAYYISEPIVVNDPKGMGAFIKASAMVENL